MHAAVVQELVDVRRRDTEVSVPALRRHRIRSVPAARERAPVAVHETNEISGPWIDPGDTLARATRVEVQLREAIVRRNHRAAPPVLTGCVEIDWARSKDLSVKRMGRGVLRIEGASSKVARASIGIDGLAFTVAIPPESRPAEVIRERLSTHYQVEIVEETGGACLVVLTGLAPIPR